MRNSQAPTSGRDFYFAKSQRNYPNYNMKNQRSAPTLRQKGPQQQAIGDYDFENRRRGVIIAVRQSEAA